MERNIYAISDIHGQYDAFMRMIDKINFGYDDELYILGDVIDRGDKSLECVKWIMENDNVLTLMGNHELMFLEACLNNGVEIYNAIKEARERLSMEELNDIVDWMNDMPICKLITVRDKKFFLSHTQALSNTYFEQSIMDQMFPEYKIYQSYNEYKNDEIISIIGHIPTLDMRIWNKQNKSNTIWKNKNGSIFDIDCGAGYPKQGGCLGCLKLNDFKEFYVEI